MASGDLKSEDAIVIEVTSGVAITKGDLCHIESDGFWDPCTTADCGKFGVALDAASGAAELVRMCIWGEVEVKATAAAIAKGALLIAGTTGFVVDAGTISETTVLATLCGTAMTAFDSGGQGVLFVGLVG
jgi:hypothetical protein